MLGMAAAVACERLQKYKRRYQGARGRQEQVVVLFHRITLSPPMEERGRWLSGIVPHPVPKSPKGPHVCPYRHVVLQAVIRRTLCFFFTRGRCKIHQCCTVWCLVVDDADGVCVCIFFEGSCWWMFQIDRQLRQFCFWFRQKQSFCKFFVVDFPSPPQKKNGHMVPINLSLPVYICLILSPFWFSGSPWKSQKSPCPSPQATAWQVSSIRTVRANWRVSWHLTIQLLKRRMMDRFLTFWHLLVWKTLLPCFSYKEFHPPLIFFHAFRCNMTADSMGLAEDDAAAN